VSELVDMLRLRQVWQAVPAQVVDPCFGRQAAPGQIAGRLRDERLPPMRDPAQPSTAINRRAVVVGRPELGLAAVDGQADPQGELARPGFGP
jgi:hypothetical protein